jgi:hypothetical protein
MNIPPKLRTALASTALGGIAFAPIADTNKFPSGWIGYALFLASVFRFLVDVR